MRFEQYLNEKYIGTYHEITEVFLNPSKRELKDAIAVTGYGYRFMVDFKKKEFYAWTDRIFHDHIMTWLRDEQGRNYLPDFHSYWYKGKENDFIFTGSYSTYDGGTFESDHMYTVEKNGSLDALLAQDMTWLNKYIDSKKMKALFQDYRDGVIH